MPARLHDSAGPDKKSCRVWVAVVCSPPPCPSHFPCPVPASLRPLDLFDPRCLGLKRLQNGHTRSRSGAAIKANAKVKKGQLNRVGTTWRIASMPPLRASIESAIKKETANTAAVKL